VNGRIERGYDYIGASHCRESSEEPLHVLLVLSDGSAEANIFLTLFCSPSYKLPGCEETLRTKRCQIFNTAMVE
jgi:hypothetical protein